MSLLFVAIAISFDINYLDYSKPVPHSNYKEISLKDFNGFKRINQNLQGGNSFAFISTEIKVIDNDVKAFFHPSRSYIYNENTIGDKALLMHELYHFHITEYIVRKIRQELAQNKGQDIHNLVEKYKQEEQQLQFDYDKQTDHSYYLGRQFKWQEKVDSLLLKLDKYK